MTGNYNTISEVISLYISSLIENNDPEWEEFMKDIFRENKHVYDMVFFKLEPIVSHGKDWLINKKYELIQGFFK